MLTPHQLEQRKGKLTASRVPEIITRPYDAWLKITGRVEEQDAGDAAKLGQYLEDGVLRAAEDFGGFKIARRNQWRVAENKIMGATLDAITTKQEIVEAKTTAVFNKYADVKAWGEPGSDEVPERVLYQVTAQFICTPEAMRAHVAAMIGRGFNIYRVERDAELCGLVEETVLKFWRDHIVADVAPSIEDAPPSLDLIRRVDRIDGPVAKIPAVIGARYLGVKQRLTEAETECDEAKAALLAAMVTEGGFAEVGECDGLGKFTNRKCKDGVTLDAEALKAAHPDLFEKFQKVRPGYRSLRHVAPKAEKALTAGKDGAS